MMLTKNRMVREIGRRTRLKNRDVQAVIETLVQLWTEELVSGGRIELENLLVLEVAEVNRGGSPGALRGNIGMRTAPSRIRRISLRPSKKLRQQLNRTFSGQPGTHDSGKE